MRQEINTLHIERDTEEFRDHIGTVTAQGKRAWIYAKKPKGRFFAWRSLVSYVLLALMFVGPYVRIHGQPLLLLNVIERKFIFFGFVFWPQDFYLAVLGVLTLVLTVVLFTALFGRVWCGWTCPQTIFLEMVFRRIEYFIEGDFQEQKQLAAAPWTARKIFRKATKFVVFYGISFAIANTFLAYIIGSEELYKIIVDPIRDHVGGFVAINLFTIVFFLVFARFREQVCQFACPYGRFQSVLVDNDSISVTYDFKRGESRGTLGQRKKAGAAIHGTHSILPIDLGAASASVRGTEGIVPAANLGTSGVASVSAPTNLVFGADQRASSSYGDCIDCGACVVVCPAGIDIRNGIQLECVQCTACIDACNKMMDAVKKPRGLIRYTSYNAIKTGRRSLMRLRTVGYLAVWLAVLSIFSWLLFTRESVELVLLRQPGLLAQKLPDGAIGNLYSAKIFNKTFEKQSIELKLAEPGSEIRYIDSVGDIQAQHFVEVRFFVAIKPEAIAQRSEVPLDVELWVNGALVRKKKSVFLAGGVSP
ncbi:MAG: 4Fe-4S binding protein [Spirochaetes bacterium]|nr:4Fe-4S binding protein [Spirochaetota bacterium]